MKKSATAVCYPSFGESEFDHFSYFEKHADDFSEKEKRE